MKIVIAGNGKSGTTALAYKVAAPLPDHRIIFEPLTRRTALETRANTVVKMRLVTSKDAKLAESYGDFEGRVLLVRDPRDWLISRQLYLWYRHPVPEPAYRRFMQRLLRKEQDPRAVDFIDLISSAVPLADEIAKVQDSVRNGRPLLDQGWYLYRYEQMVSGDFDGLEAYLGLAVGRDTEVAAKHARVVRSKAAGNWRHWFTPADVERLRPLLSDSLTAWGYDTGDWRLADRPRLDPATGSDYVRGLRGSRLQRWYRKTRRATRARLRY